MAEYRASSSSVAFTGSADSDTFVFFPIYSPYQGSVDGGGGQNVIQFSGYNDPFSSQRIYDLSAVKLGNIQTIEFSSPEDTAVGNAVLTPLYVAILSPYQFGSGISNNLNVSGSFQFGATPEAVYVQSNSDKPIDFSAAAWTFSAWENPYDHIAIGGSSGNDKIVGASVPTELFGNAGNDTLIGGGGNDTLTGGAGLDRLTGGGRADVFKDTAAGLNGDTIADFTTADYINISDAISSDFAFKLSNDGKLSYNGGSLTLANLPTGYHLVATAAADNSVDLALAQDPPSTSLVPSDFNGDGFSDILWRNDNGQLSDWLGTTGGGFTDNGGVVHNMVSTSWHVADTGDFNGDGLSDILWRNDSGQLSDWLGTASGGFTDNGAVVHNMVPISWHVADTGDFNGDGLSDILWRNDSGQLSDWLGTASGGFTDNGGVVHNMVPTSWHVADTGDFNGDGLSDILWRNDNGQLSDWLGTAGGGFTDNGGVVHNMVPTSWHVADTGDFNGDGRSDILWRNDSGQLSDWLGTAGGGFTDNGGVVHNMVSTSWHVADTGDFNGDGLSDILWRNDSGQLSDWLGTASGGFTDNGGVVHNVVPTSWHVQTQAYLAG